MGVSVTQRIKGTKNCPAFRQPRGGFLPPREFTVENLGYDPIPRDGENISASLVGTVVDYMSRFRQGTPKKQAFAVSIQGAGLVGQEGTARKLLRQINGDDDLSIFAACQLASYDSLTRAEIANDLSKAQPNGKTIVHIRKMLWRTDEFFKAFGPVVLDGFSVNDAPGAYIDKGDGDFLTTDSLWDFKVLSGKLTPKHTLQLLVYWRMGLRTTNAALFERVKWLGVFNPRLGNVYSISVDEISQTVIAEVEEAVIGYGVAKSAAAAFDNYAENLKVAKARVRNQQRGGPRGCLGSTIWQVKQAIRGFAKWCWNVLLLVIVVCFLSGTSSSCDANSPGNNARHTVEKSKVKSSQSSSGKTPIAQKGTSRRTSKLCTVTLVSTEVKKPYAWDGEQLEIVLSWTNHNKKPEAFYWEIEGTATQDGKVLDSGSFGFTSVDKYRSLAKNNTKEVTPGKTVRVLYEVTLKDTSHPVRLKLRDAHQNSKVVFDKTLTSTHPPTRKD